MRDTETGAATLPAARGPLSAAVLSALGGRPAPAPPDVDAAGAFGEDLQLALHLCYELHYRGHAGVPDALEWDPDLLRLRAALERRFLAALAEAVPGGADVQAALDELLAEPAEGGGLTGHLDARGEWWQVREFFAHRSIYHLKEADPYAWAIPRLDGRAKAALVAVEFDEYGGGRAERVHSRLFADLLAGADLDPTYLGYQEHAVAGTFAIVNLATLFGLHRRWRGALAGHFAVTEITSAPSSARMDRALRRLGAAPECRLFYTEHVEADAVHEQVLRRDVLGDLCEREPELAADIVFGVQAAEVAEQLLADHVLAAWRAGRSSLRAPLAEPVAGVAR